jgi:predicted transcriptional regulator of viral defense system
MYDDSVAMNRTKKFDDLKARPKRSDAGIDLVRRLASEGLKIFSLDQARKGAPHVALRQAYVAEALHHLERQGWIVRLKRGLYAVSSSVPGVVPVHEFEIAMALVKPAAISHWSALHYHGLTDQAPRTVFVLTSATRFISRLGATASAGEGTLQGPRLPQFQFISIKKEWFFGTQDIWIGDSRVTVTDPERTLLDGLARPRYCGDLAEVLHAFETRGDKLDVKKIVGYALKLDAAMAKRLGWVLEQRGVPPDALEALRNVPIRGYRKLDPSGLAHGPYIRRWMIQENLPGRRRS